MEKIVIAAHGHLQLQRNRSVRYNTITAAVAPARWHARAQTGRVTHCAARSGGGNATGLQCLTQNYPQVSRFETVRRRYLGELRIGAHASATALCGSDVTYLNISSHGMRDPEPSEQQKKKIEKIFCHL
ncbi:hypothetical protein EVAR_4395_1 [Eumeta japonica]|uniref:Uncharacterized protein n=1 Tax=Eumeta variegata TaxID=151549 RepID=A0A4C1SXG6_EUMVA|nr:hypothetical protein EVAR_4395_1 [Eumeta japonica]